MAVSDDVKRLIERFDQNLDSYRSPNYNETQLRIEFLDPFFKALGWDINNEQGFAEAYKEVIHEDAIKVGGFTKAPDYCFRIGSERKFFLEAKKPAINIKEDVTPAYQLRRYAWSAKLPLSILSDFDEFATYDCRVKPLEGDKPSTARILYIPYREYEDRWEEIYSIFSKEAVLKGSFDRYAESAKKKKGTAEVDDAFLSDIESWRDVLARNLALRNPSLSQRELNYSVQVTIDRIIFLRICEDRGIENYGQLLALTNGLGISPRLLEVFQRADDRYNSGLFHFQKEKNRYEAPDTLTPHLIIDDKVLKDIIKSLYYPSSPYEFSVLPADILGHVYEQFLGKVIRLTAGHQAKVEDKPEVKKAGGVYYTPTYIVEYIVGQTVGKLLEGKSPRQASKLKILDPACGSGSFLIGAYQKLLDWHRDWYLEHEPEKRKEVYQGRGGGWKLTVAERKRILLNNIYGVDIDPQAVEVTKLSLLLKVLEDESEQSLANQMQLFHQRALPDLSSNIKCGNSLIGPDFYADRQMSITDNEERWRVNAFDWEVEFSEIFTGDNPGFDIVIGNPPYGSNHNEDEKVYFNSEYLHQNYQLDNYQLFMEKSLNSFLRQGGCFGMIIPNPWLTNLLQSNIRKLVLNMTNIKEIVHFMFPVFPKVTVDTEVVILEKNAQRDWKPKVIVYRTLGAAKGADNGEDARVIEHNQQDWIDLDGDVINIFLEEKGRSLVSKCLEKGAKLESAFNINVGIKPYQVGKGRPSQTRGDVDNRVYDSDTRIDAKYRQILRGADINRYVVNPVKIKYIKYGKWLAEPRFSANFDAHTKILMRQTGDSLIAAIDMNQMLAMNNMHVLVPKSEEIDLYCTIGIINSELMNWYYHTLNPEVGEALAEVKKTNIARLPAFIEALSNDKRIKRITSKISEAVKSIIIQYQEALQANSIHDKILIKRQIDATDRYINQLVYELYELTPEEIKIVEAHSSGLEIMGGSERD
jgi:hypothetical protein